MVNSVSAETAWRAHHIPTIIYLFQTQLKNWEGTAQQTVVMEKNDTASLDYAEYYGPVWLDSVQGS